MIYWYLKIEKKYILDNMIKDERFSTNDITSKDILDFYAYIEDFLTN